MAVKTYKHSDLSNVTEHFKVSEFRCKCGGAHDVLISDELVQKLEGLRTALNCSKIVVNSGYRCSKHDKHVGGSGSGQHTTGKAADIVCYGADGKVISSKIITCAAQDIGFSGIANIDGTYTSVHIDIANRKWYGDETVTKSKSITEDFYKHWGLSRADVYGDAFQNTKSVTLIIDGVTYEGTLTKKQHNHSSYADRF